jgi:BsuBI/PstI restriction endonuclease domain
VDFMASMFGPSKTASCSTSKIRWGLLVKAILEVFCTRWAPGASILGICDTERREFYVDSNASIALGITLDSPENLPGVIIHHETKNRLTLVEPVIKSGPLDEKRRQELQNLVAGSDSCLVFVTAFENRQAMQTFGSEIAWESEVWFAEDPDHMIHFNGGRFLGPYRDVMQR